MIGVQMNDVDPCGLSKRERDDQPPDPIGVAL
jgi:hypothetical protein